MFGSYTDVTKSYPMSGRGKKWKEHCLEAESL